MKRHSTHKTQLNLMNLFRYCIVLISRLGPRGDLEPSSECSTRCQSYKHSSTLTLSRNKIECLSTTFLGLSIICKLGCSLPRGARKLTGENLKLVWAEFSTISQAILKMCMKLNYVEAHPRL